MALVSLRGSSLNRAVALHPLGMATAGARHPRNFHRGCEYPRVLRARFGGRVALRQAFQEDGTTRSGVTVG